MDYIKIISDEIQKNFDIEDLQSMLEVPQDESMGDFAVPCFKLARFLKKAPPMIANEICEKFEKPAEISKVEVAGGYLNFFIDKEIFIKNTLQESKKEKYGSSNEGQGKKVVMDYSSINIAKPFHIGHIMSTSIGNALNRIYKYHGYEAIGINHLGDWGTQFGKLIYAYETWGNKEDVSKRGLDALLELYIKFHDEADKDETLDDKGRAWFKQIEDGDEYAIELLDWFTEITLSRVKEVYKLLDVEFDYYTGERFYNDKMQSVIDELEAKDLLVDSEGARVVDMQDEKVPPCIIVKKDGTTLYSTRDLAAAFYRKKEFDFYKALYIVAYQQNLHFQQWFKVVDLMGYDWSKSLEHVNFGMVSLQDGTLSTRKGKIVFLEDVLSKAIEKTKEIIEQKNPNLEEKDDIAKKVGVGAVVFSVLSQGRIKDVTFSFDRVLNFEGETGPYTQYTYVRCNSLIKRAGDIMDETPDYSALDNNEAFKVAKAISKFPEAVKSALDKNEPYLVTRSVLDVAKAFNKFYFEHKIIDEDRAKSKARLMVADSAKNVIKTGLYLIGVQTPEKM